MAKPKINVLFFSIMALILLGILGLSQFVNLQFQGQPVSMLGGFVILIALCGISVYHNPLPGLLAALAWGLVGREYYEFYTRFVNSEIIVIVSMLVYYHLIKLQPKSTWNVYWASLSGAIVMLGLRCFEYLSWHPSYGAEFVGVLVVVKILINKLRDLNLINHEDREKIVDPIQRTYNKINRRFGTNLKRPARPTKEGKIC